MFTNTGHASVDVSKNSHRPVSPEPQPVRPAVAAFDTTDGLSRDHDRPQAMTDLLGDPGGVVNSLDFCPASLKSLGCLYFRCVLSNGRQ